MSVNAHSSTTAPTDDTIYVIGGGLSRTGTISLKLALEYLYQKPCYHMKKIIISKPSDLKRWWQIIDQMENDEKHTLDKAIVKDIFKGFACALDVPVAGLHDKLLQIYPNAKIVVTVRPADKWLNSLRKTVRPNRRHLSNGLLDSFIEKTFIGSNFYKLIDYNLQKCLGPDVNLNSDEQVLVAYDEYYKRIAATYPPERLLMFDYVRDGWKPLCNFLNKPIPNIPYPHANETKILAEEIRKLYALRKLIKIFILYGVAFLVLAIMVLLKLFYF